MNMLVLDRNKYESIKDRIPIRLVHLLDRYVIKEKDGSSTILKSRFTNADGELI